MSFFRRFELTIGVYLPVHADLPVTFEDWIHAAGFDTPIATPTTLERIVETRYPLSEDVVDRRRDVGMPLIARPW